MKRALTSLLAAGLLVGIAGAAAAHPAKGSHGKAHKVANSKMTFRLDDHHVTVGDTVTGTVHLATRDEHHWTPLADADVAVLVDGDALADDADAPVVLTTDADGNAVLEYVTTIEGEHVLRVAYAGDEAHRARQRSQGFEAQAASDDDGSGDDGTDEGGDDTPTG